MSASPTGVELLVKEIVKGVARELGTAPMQQRLLTLKQAAEYLGWTVGTLQQRTAAGDIPYVKMPGSKHRRWDRAKLDKLIEDGERTGM